MKTLFTIILICFATVCALFSFTHEPYIAAMVFFGLCAICNAASK